MRVAAVSAAFVFLFTEAFAQSAPSQPKWGAHIDVEGKWGNRRSLGDIGLFAPLFQDRTSLVFADVRGRLDDDNGSEGNFGIGYRTMLQGRWNAGVYGYYDTRRTPLGNRFSQATLGAEFLHPDYDLRANVYLPFGRREYGLGVVPFAEFSGGTLQIVTPAGGPVERSLRGADFEAGYRIPLFPVESLVQLRAYAGAFWFDGENLVKDVAGPRGRIELSWDNLPYLNEGSRLTLGFEAQHDDLRGSNHFAMARLRIPLSPQKNHYARLSPQERRMTERIVRDVDIVAAKVNKGSGTQTTEAAINEYNNLQVTDVVQTTDAASTQTALDNRSSGSIVILNGAITLVGNSRIEMNTAGHTLIGGGGTLPLRGATTGTQVTFIAPGAAGSISGNSTGHLRSQAADNVIAGLQLTTLGSWTTSLGVLGHNNVVAGNTFSIAPGEIGYGLYVMSADNARIIGNTFMGSLYFAMEIGQSNGTQVSNNTFSSDTTIGVYASNVTNLTVRNNVFFSSDYGVMVGSATNIIISENVFQPSVDVGIWSFNTSFVNSIQNVDNGVSVARCQFAGGVTGTISFTSGPSC